MPKYDRELIARMLSCYDGGGYTDQAVAEQIRLLREADNLEADARTVVREAAEAFLEAADARDNEETATQYPQHELRLRQYKAARDELESLISGGSHA